MYGAQESIMFLIDASKQMFEKNIDGNGIGGDDQYL